MSVESPVEQTPVASLRLKTGADRRLRAGHLWIYSNEVNTDMTPLKGLSAGAVVVVEDDRGHFVGMNSVSISPFIGRSLVIPTFCPVWLSIGLAIICRYS